MAAVNVVHGNWLTCLEVNGRTKSEAHVNIHLFVDCEHIILPDNRVVECQIEGEGELRAKAHQISANVADLRASRVRTAEDEDERATATDCHAQCLLPCDRLLENEEGEYHGKDRHRCGDNAGIDRRGDAQPDVVQSLVKHDAEQSRSRAEQPPPHETTPQRCRQNHCSSPPCRPEPSAPRWPLQQTYSNVPARAHGYPSSFIYNSFLLLMLMQSY